MKLSELILAVKEEKLTKEQLGDYETQISNLFVQMMLERATLEKEEALFMNGKDKSDSAISRKIQWRATPSGQRLIDIKCHLSATKEMLNSIKSRTYKLIY